MPVPITYMPGDKEQATPDQFGWLGLPLLVFPVAPSEIGRLTHGRGRVIDRRADRELGRGRKPVAMTCVTPSRGGSDVGRRIEDDAQPVTVNARRI